QAGRPAGPGPFARAVGPDGRPVPGAGWEDDPGGAGPAGPAGPGPGAARRPGPPPPRRGARHAAAPPAPRPRPAGQNASARAGPGLRGGAGEGKTCRGARRADGTRVHLLGATEHGGHLLDHLEVGVKHNETSHFTELLGPLELAGAVVTTDALHTVRANLDWLVKDKKAHYIP